MEFHATTSPHLHAPTSVTRVMGEVLLALIPALVGIVWVFGWGAIVNIVIAVPAALAAEAAMLAARGRPIRTTLMDLSAVLTAVLLAISIPPLSPWWLTVTGVVFAMVFVKHLYGGLGYNPFNPAMAGYVLLLVSFPREMTQWLPPEGLVHGSLGLGDALNLIFGGQTPQGLGVDALSQATPLDTVRQQVTLLHHTIQDAKTTTPVFGLAGGKGWEIVSALYLLGGIWMVRRNTIGWQIPVGVLVSLLVLAGLFNLYDPSRYASPLFHLFSGATMLEAFFIATDPVTASTTPWGRIGFGIGVGSLIYLIRTFGGYPDAGAFAVLIMNMMAPTLDHYTQPRVYGHP